MVLGKLSERVYILSYSKPLEFYDSCIVFVTTGGGSIGNTVTFALRCVLVYIARMCRCTERDMWVIRLIDSVYNGSSTEFHVMSMIWK